MVFEKLEMKDLGLEDKALDFASESDRGGILSSS